METSPSEHHGYDHEHSQDVREEERNVCLFFPNFSVTLFKKKKNYKSSCLHGVKFGCFLRTTCGQVEGMYLCNGEL